MTLDIRIMDRASAADIDEEDWVSLEKNACVPNPFYERWNLLSALKYLDRKDTVYVIAAYDQDRLVCLFPVCLMKKAGLFKFLAIWRFRDCLRTDVLRVSDISLSTIFLEVMQHFSAKALVSATHEKWHIDAQLIPNFCDVLKSRKAIFNRYSWEGYLAKQKRKHRKENRRVLSRLTERESVKYVTSDHSLAEKWLSLYFEVEKQSWKAERGNAISSNADRVSYFREAIGRGEQQNKVEFQALMKDEECFAISFRYKSKNIAYEIGTTYTEKYKNYYPGVALELLNIRNILESDYEMADSCSAHNTVVDRIWPDDIVLCRTVIFENSLLGRAGKGIYRMLKKSRLIQQQQLFCD